MVFILDTLVLGPCEEEIELRSDDIQRVPHTASDLIRVIVQFDREFIRVMSLNDPDSVINHFLPFEPLHLQSYVHHVLDLDVIASGDPSHTLEVLPEETVSRARERRVCKLRHLLTLIQKLGSALKDPLILL